MIDIPDGVNAAERADMRIEVVKRELNQGALAGFESAVTDYAAGLVVTALDTFDDSAVQAAFRRGFELGEANQHLLAEQAEANGYERAIAALRDDAAYREWAQSVRVDAGYWPHGWENAADYLAATRSTRPRAEACTSQCEAARLMHERDEARAEVKVLEGALDGNRIATHNMQRLMEDALTKQWAAESERDRLRAVVQIADDYESAWGRYANPRPGPTEIERVLEKANAHQALLDAVRRHRSEVPPHRQADGETQ